MIKILTDFFKTENYILRYLLTVRKIKPTTNTLTTKTSQRYPIFLSVIPTP